MKKKNIIALFLATVMLVSLVSCADPVAGDSGIGIDPGAAPSTPAPAETEALTLGSMELPLPDPAQSSVVTVDEVYRMLDAAKAACNMDGIIILSDGTERVCAKISEISENKLETASKNELYAYYLYTNNVLVLFDDMLMQRFPETSILLRSEISKGSFPYPDYFFLDPIGEGFENARDAFEKGCNGDSDAAPDGNVSVLGRIRGGYVIFTKETGDKWIAEMQAEYD